MRLPLSTPRLDDRTRLGAVCLLLGALTVPATVSAQAPGETALRVHRAGGYADQLPVFRGEGFSDASMGSSGPPPPSDPNEVVTHGERDGANADDPAAETPRPRHRAGRTSTSGGGADPVAARTRRAPRHDAGPSLSLPEGVGTGLAYVLLAVGIVFLVVLFGAVLYSMRDSFSLPAREARAKSASQLAEAAPLAVRMVEGDPDELAARGELAAAIAALLLRALMAVGWSPTGHGRSRTAREILRAVDPADPRRVPLGDLVAIEERVAFAGDPATREAYERARALFEAVRERGA